MPGKRRSGIGAWLRRHLIVRGGADNQGREKNRGWWAGLGLSFGARRSPSEAILEESQPSVYQEGTPELTAAEREARLNGEPDFVGYITGYYTPVEFEFDESSIVEIAIDEVREQFRETFVDAVMMEGWGRTVDGWYLGRYSGRWHRSESPRDARGNALEVGVVAVDPARVGLGSKLKFPSLPGEFGKRSFEAADVGGAIDGYDIDIYCGEGDDARKLSYAVTGKAPVWVLPS